MGILKRFHLLANPGIKGSALLFACLWLAFFLLLPRMAHPDKELFPGRILICLCFGIVFFGIPIPVMARRLEAFRYLGFALAIPLLWILLKGLGPAFVGIATWAIPLGIAGSWSAAAAIARLRNEHNNGNTNGESKTCLKKNH